MSALYTHVRCEYTNKYDPIAKRSPSGIYSKSSHAFSWSWVVGLEFHQLFTNFPIFLCFCFVQDVASQTCFLRKNNNHNNYISYYSLIRYYIFTLYVFVKNNIIYNGGFCFVLFFFFVRYSFRRLRNVFIGIWRKTSERKSVEFLKLRRQNNSAATSDHI